MGHTLDFIDDQEIVKVVFNGKASVEDHEAVRTEAARALSSRGWGKLLVDARNIESEMSVIDDFGFTKSHKSHKPPLECVAVIHRQDETERFRFIENVALNRGQHMKVFTDEREAIDWLTSA